MEILALICAVLGVAACVVAASPRSVPSTWQFGWIGVALLGAALLIWHTVADVGPVFT